MKHSAILFCTSLSMLAAPLWAATVEADVKTHAMTGSVEVVEGAKAMLVSSEAGIAGSLTTSQLTPGHVYTMWVAIMNNPAACELKEAEHCTSGEVINNAAMVESDVTYGDGVVAPADGIATFRTFLPAGELGYSWLGNGLTNPTGAEIHFALHDHGPVISEDLVGMMTTARGGCLEESLPKGWPDSARASGEPGPNSCTMAQFAILKQQ